MSISDTYFSWLTGETPTTWWHDSGDPEELGRALALHASGVTTNPVLTYQAVSGHPQNWSAALATLNHTSDPAERAETLLQYVVKNAAKMFEPIYHKSQGVAGYVCAQVNPALAHDREAMLAMGRRFHAWAPNIAVKFPVTAAGLDTLEECVAEGITITGTVSFCLPQLLAIAERHRKGTERAQKTGKTPGRCFAVMMIGRLDDYLRIVALDQRAPLKESDLLLPGLAVTKRASEIYRRRGYQATLLVAALRGKHHMIHLAGGELIMSIHPKYQAMFLEPDMPREMRIDEPIDKDVIDRWMKVPEFVRAYEPDGMTPQEFMSFGVTQRTLSQFIEAGWAKLEKMKA